MILNIKSNYSLLSSMLRIDDIIEYSIKNNQLTASLCDNNMYGVMNFYQKCIKNNLKPIIGLEIKTDELDICLYIKDYRGYQSLIKLSTIQNERIVKLEDLKEYKDNLICIVNFSKKELFSSLKEYYEDLYLGYSTKEEEKIAQTITTNIVFFRECLYLNKEDASYLPYLYRVRDGKTITDEITYDYLNHELDIQNILDFTSNEGLMNIEKIIAKCNLNFPKAELLLPIYHPENI